MWITKKHISVMTWHEGINGKFTQIVKHRQIEPYKMVKWITLSGTKPCIIITGKKLWYHLRGICTATQEEKNDDTLFEVIVKYYVALSLPWVLREIPN